MILTKDTLTALTAAGLGAADLAYLAIKGGQPIGDLIDIVGKEIAMAAMDRHVAEIKAIKDACKPASQRPTDPDLEITDRLMAVAWIAMANEYATITDADESALITASEAAEAALITAREAAEAATEEDEIKATNEALNKAIKRARSAEIKIADAREATLIKFLSTREHPAGTIYHGEDFGGRPKGQFGTKVSEYRKKAINLSVRVDARQPSRKKKS